MNILTEVAWWKLLLNIFYILPIVGKYTKDPITIDATFCSRSEYWTYEVYAGESNIANWDGSELSEGCKIEFEPENLDIFNKYTVCMETTSFSLSCKYAVKVGIDKTTTVDDESDYPRNQRVFSCGSLPPKICTTDTYEALVIRIEPTTNYDRGSRFSIKVTAYDHGDDSAINSTPMLIPIIASVVSVTLICICIVCLAKRSQANRRSAQENYTHVLQQGIQYVDQQPPHPPQPPQPYSQTPNAAQNIQMNSMPNVQYNPQPRHKDMYSVDPPSYSSLQYMDQHSSVPPKGPGSITGQPLQLPVSQEECTYKVYDAV